LTTYNGGTSGSIDCADNLTINVDHCKITQSIGNGINTGNNNIITVTDSEINTILRTGIAFNGDDISLSIIGTSFYDNYSAVDDHGRGDNSSISIENSHISGSEIGIQFSDTKNLHLIMKNSSIYEGGSAIRFQPSTYASSNSSIYLENVNIFNNTTTTSGVGTVLLISNCTGSLRGCELYGNDSEWLYYSESPIDWYRCKVSNNSSSWQHLLRGGYYYNCIIENNNCDQYVVTGSFKNSVIYGNNSQGVFMSGGGPVINSIIWNNVGGVNYTGSNALYSNIQEAVTGIGNISMDPLFADGDYHLTEESPCKDSGNPSPEYNDIDGSRNDMGVFGGPNGGW
jgi:hypothetical protein